MKKRAVTGFLWFYATWYAWNFVAVLLGVTDAMGPVLGLVAAYLFAGDPLGRIWRSVRTSAQPITTTSSAPEPA
jgi:hypothetical protein